MVMRYAKELEIEDIRHHPAEMIAMLRTLLEEGTPVTPDPKRSDFYEIESDSVVYYVHISPVTGKILLLATWPTETALEGAHAAA